MQDCEQIKGMGLRTIQMKLREKKGERGMFTFSNLGEVRQLSQSLRCHAMGRRKKIRQRRRKEEKGNQADVRREDTGRLSSCSGAIPVERKRIGRSLEKKNEK